MRIVFHTPFKPLTHPRISGDVTIARDLLLFLQNRGHEVRVAPECPSSWIWRRPGRWSALWKARRETRTLVRGFHPHLWLTYHSYYKAPDLLGPHARGLEGGPCYAIFSAGYADKRRRNPVTWPGFKLNLRALGAADRVFTNKASEYETCSRVVDPSRLEFVPPGIHTQDFSPDPAERRRMREAWGAGDKVVVACAAMFRPGTKADGVATVIEACVALAVKGLDPFLVLAGEGGERSRLEALARERLPGRILFLGRVPREELASIYSAADLFAFPGIREGLGMAYLEAQCCGLPAVALAGWGPDDVIQDGKTGYLADGVEVFSEKLERLARDRELRESMGSAARRHVLDRHDLEANYASLEESLLRLAGHTEGGDR